MQGGAALFWRPRVGGGKVFRSESHRYMGVGGAFGTVVSAYGPASVPSTEWMDEVSDWIKVIAAGKPWVIRGSLNWRQSYQQRAPTDATACQMTAPTTLAGTTPTRLCASSVAVQHASTVFVQGIPYHGLVLRATPWSAMVGPTTRLKRTSIFELDQSTMVLPQDIEALQSDVDQALPMLGMAYAMTQRWERWHARANRAMELGVEAGLLIRGGSAERPKGSSPEERPVASTLKRRPNEPVILS
eukprot:1219424-Pyramimonas_sp.AAC.1